MTRYFSPDSPSAYPEQFGFRSDARSVHGSRTIMLADLTKLLDALPAAAQHTDYQRAILEDNALGKRTASTRLWGFKKLRELYALDPDVPLFRVLRQFWGVDVSGRPLLALLVAASRDGLLRASIEAVIPARPGTEVTKDMMRASIVRTRGDRFAATTMKSLLANLSSSWTDSGHLTGRKTKLRARPEATPATAALALLLGYLTGARGLFLFETTWASLLDRSVPELDALAREASRRGWLTYRGVGDVVDITFERLLTPAERQMLGEDLS